MISTKIFGGLSNSFLKTAENEKFLIDFSNENQRSIISFADFCRIDKKIGYFFPIAIKFFEAQLRFKRIFLSIFLFLSRLLFEIWIWKLPNRIKNLGKYIVMSVFVLCDLIWIMFLNCELFASRSSLKWCSFFRMFLLCLFPISD